MKVDKRNYKHWIYIFVSACYLLIATALRVLRLNRKQKTVILYGHKLNGNLKAFADYYASRPNKDFELFYLTMDRQYYHQLQAEPQPVKILTTTNFRDARKVANSQAIISDHTPQLLTILQKLTSIKF